jgi:hypothetical protein
MQPQDIATIETDIFEHRQVKRHFINPCCFGEDFAAWLKERLADLTREGFEFSEPIQEDYGWGLWAKHGKDSFWIALSYVGDGPCETPAQWVVSIAHETGLNLFKRFFSKPELIAMRALRERIRRELESKDGIKILEPA